MTRPASHLAAFLALVLLPIHVQTGVPFWRQPPPEILQSLAWGIGYLLLALPHDPGTRLGDGRGRGAGRLVLAALSWWGLAYLFLRLGLEVPVSRRLALASLAGALLLLLLPGRLARSRMPVALVLWALVSGSVLYGLAALPPLETTGTIRTALHPIRLVTFRDLVPTAGTSGGAIARHGDGFLVANAVGEFTRLSWSPDGRRLNGTRLPLEAPMEVSAFRAAYPDASAAYQYRVTDLLVEEAGGTTTIHVAHLKWHADRDCMTLQVSRTTLDVQPGPAAADGRWHTIFESRPCHPLGLVARLNQSGGQLARLPDGAVLLTLGDHGFDGLNAPAFAQDTAADYGKVVRIEPAGRTRHLTMGHRNPQGLVAAADGRVWIADQGPQGGDELNLLVEGANYGWPIATYGTNYGSETWPVGPGGRDHGDFEEPRHVWVPSPAISSMIQLAGTGFPRWSGDLLLGSLKAQSLLRIRLRGGDVTYAEMFAVGERVRDLAEGTDGRVVLWTDSGNFLVLEPADDVVAGAAAYQRCQECHGPDLEGTDRGPPLRGVVERRVAGWPGYAYSQGLRAVTGLWTDERLDAFLADPAAFAPGTTMEAAPVTSPAERAALVEFLRRR